MKTVRQAIVDEIYYPVNTGLIDNKLLARGIDPDDDFNAETSGSDPYKGALADTIFSLVQAVNVSESDKSVGSLSDAQRKALMSWANRLYSSIGEDTIESFSPTVYINC